MLTTVRPKLHLDFARAKRLDPRITSSRGSVASYFDQHGVLRYARDNEPRFNHDPLTGECLGLLCEGGSTNIFTYSEDIANAVWTKVATTVTGDSTTAPDGSLADLLLETVDNSEHRIGRTVSYTAGTTYTLSVFVKAAGRNHPRLLFNNAAFGVNTSAYYDLTAVTSKVGVGTPVSHGIQAVGNGWFRLWLTATATISAAAATQLNVSQDYGVTAPPSYVGDAAKGVYVWGLQLEASSAPSSYIQTTSSTASRNEDRFSISSGLDKWFNSTEGTFVVGLRTDYLVNPAIGVVLATRYGSESENQNTIRIQRNYQAVETAVYSTSTLASYFYGTTNQLMNNTLVRAALRYKANDFQVVVDGVAEAGDTTGAVPATVADQLFIGGAVASGKSAWGHIDSIYYWDSALPDIDMKALT